MNKPYKQEVADWVAMCLNKNVFEFEHSSRMDEGKVSLIWVAKNVADVLTPCKGKFRRDTFTVFYDGQVIEKVHYTNSSVYPESISAEMQGYEVNLITMGLLAILKNWVVERTEESQAVLSLLEQT